MAVTSDGSHDLIATLLLNPLLAGGHYVAFAKNSSRNSWFEFNDTRVRPVTADTVQDAEGYVLFYRYHVSSFLMVGSVLCLPIHVSQS